MRREIFRAHRTEFLIGFGSGSVTSIHMGKSAAEKMKTMRERRERGVRVFSFEFSVQEAQDLLRGWLREEDLNDMAMLQVGMKHLLHMLQFEEEEIYDRCRTPL